MLACLNPGGCDGRLFSEDIQMHPVFRQLTACKILPKWHEQPEP